MKLDAAQLKILIGSKQGPNCLAHSSTGRVKLKEMPSHDTDRIDRHTEAYLVTLAGNAVACRARQTTQAPLGIVDSRLEPSLDWD